MSLKEQLLEIENSLAAGDGAVYEKMLTDDAVVIIPGQVLSKSETVSAMNEGPGWDEFKIEDSRLLAVGDGAILTYRFSGRRGEDYRYTALMSSAYSPSDGAWKLVLHQQTPLPEN